MLVACMIVLSVQWCLHRRWALKIQKLTSTRITERWNEQTQSSTPKYQCFSLLHLPVSFSKVCLPRPWLHLTGSHFLLRHLSVSLSLYRSLIPFVFLCARSLDMVLRSTKSFWRQLKYYVLILYLFLSPDHCVMCCRTKFFVEVRMIGFYLCVDQNKPFCLSLLLQAEMCSNVVLLYTGISGYSVA